MQRESTVVEYYNCWSFHTGCEQEQEHLFDPKICTLCRGGGGYTVDTINIIIMVANDISCRPETEF